MAGAGARMGPPGTYPLPVASMPWQPSGMYQSQQAPGLPGMQTYIPQPLFWPVPLQQEEPPAPWWALLVGGLGLGTTLAFLGSLLWRRRADHAASELPSVAPQWVNWDGRLVPMQQGMVMAPGVQAPVERLPMISGQAPSMEPITWPSTMSGMRSTGILEPKPAIAAIDQAAGHDTGDSNEEVTANQLKELTSLMRTHVENTRDATASFKRALELHQRQFTGAFADFQRKLEEASRKKSNAASQRVEISPESLQMLRSLISPNGSNGCGTTVAANGSGDGNGEALRQWFEQVHDNLRRLLRSAGSKTEARRSLQTVSMIVHNLVTNPAQEKYREVNPSSIRFRETFGATDGAAANLLQLAGFELQGEAFMFLAERSLDQAERVRDFMQDALRDCDRRWEQANGITDPAEAGEVNNDAIPIQAPTRQPSIANSPVESDPETIPPWLPRAPMASGTSGPVGSTFGASSSSCNNGTNMDLSVNSQHAAGSGIVAEVPKPSAPWASKTVQKQLSRMPMGGGVTTPNQSQSAASAGGSVSVQGGEDTRPPVPGPAPVHPAEAQMAPQEPQSGG